MNLHHRILRANIVQMLAIAVATLCSVGISAAIMEQIFLRKAISEEAKFYWEQSAKDPSHPLPHTKNMIGYLEYHLPPDTFYFLSRFKDTVRTPQHISGLPPGYHSSDLDGVHRLIYVSVQNYKTLYLIIDKEEISNLSFFFGVVPLMMSLLGLYLLSWLTQRLFLSTVSPILQLASQIEKINLNEPAVLEVPENLTYQDHEILTLYHGTQKLLDRVQESVNREKRFSRDASHELRTPLAVMRGSLDIIQKQFRRISHVEAPLQERIQRSLNRAYRSSTEMEKLIAELLMLAREDYEQVPSELVNCNELVDLIIEELNQVFHDSKVVLKACHKAQWEAKVPRSVLRVVITNIASNAMRYTQEGQVTITTWENTFEIIDTGEGFDPEFLKHAFAPFARGHHENTKGFGLGLSIVKRFCDHYGWKIETDSTLGEGSTFKIIINEAVTRA